VPSAIVQRELEQRSAAPVAPPFNDPGVDADQNFAIIDDAAIVFFDQGRLLVVLTGRDGDWLPTQWQVEQFDLAPLTDEQTNELIRALDATVSDEERAEVRSRCYGVPFYIEQVVAGLRRASSDSTHVPDALYEPLFARLRAGDNVVPVVEAAAVGHRPPYRPIAVNDGGRSRRGAGRRSHRPAHGGPRPRAIWEHQLAFPS
jgi:hypothetical protein